MSSILLIGDAHVRPGVSNERFTWLGNLCVDLQPDIIVDLGDWEDMPSLSSYDKGKRCYEGRRYSEDIQAACDARSKFNAPIDRYNLGRKRAQKRAYSPRKVALGGNHFEGRIERATQLDPALHGTISVADGRHQEFGWEYVPYLRPIEIEGFTFQHYFTTGIMGRPIAGEMPSLNLIKKHFSSSIQGHNHLLDISHRTRPNGDRVWGICAGCFLAEDQWEDYAGPANKMWWRGVILLSGCSGGDFESLTLYTIQEIKRKYSGN